MGIKGDKHSNESALTAALLAEKLAGIGDISTKKMFGGNGIFHDGKMFGMVDSKGQAYLKANESNKSQFEDAGAKPHGKMPYYAIPSEVMSNQDQLIVWAISSMELKG